MEGGLNLFPRHLADPQKILSLGGVWMAGLLIWLTVRASAVDPPVGSSCVTLLSGGPSTQ